MKKLIALGLMLFSTIVCEAVGVAGRVVNPEGRPVADSHVIVAWGREKFDASTDGEGRFVIECPDEAAGAKVKIYTEDDKVTTATIPKEGETGYVMVQLKLVK